MELRWEGMGGGLQVAMHASLGEQVSYVSHTGSTSDLVDSKGE